MPARLLLASSVVLAAAGAHAQAPAWNTSTINDSVVLSFGAAGKPGVFTVWCNKVDGTGNLSPGGHAARVGDGQTINVVISGPGGKASYAGLAHFDPATKVMEVSIELPRVPDALAPLSKPGTLTIRYPKNRHSLPLDAKAADALKAFRAQCPAAKG